MTYLPFFDLNIFYYLTLDTPICNKALKNSKLIKIHDKDWSEFIEASIISSLTLLRHINTQNTHELKGLSEDLVSIYNIKEEYLTILLNKIQAQITTLDKFSSKRLQELNDNLNGIIK